MEARVMQVLKQSSLHIPSQVLTDQDVADRIRLDMQKRARKVRDHGVFAYTQPIAPTQNVNKGFLLNTIKSVDTHNQRQEVDACYRKRQLEQHLDDNPRRQRQRLDTRKRSRSQDRRPPSRDITASDHVHEREFWAARKALKSQAILDKVGDRMCSVDNAPAYESDEKAAKKHKKRAKNAQKKLKKLKKKRKAD
ncbi:hypothetical protein H257_13438 [Aphanomyces astaci]|uniref:Uncharacterized protein n=1 Tax=Aphanomyces astaci TaxID=112090 RepID=W4FUY7_APHAT|nr:hypothetical protein H257_13438 [Aphanomyces astaci]ETV71307.1 hypothetical protein H257_13438 [Aphanomyces astaci]|eukprot:XP_009839247.1 hypothetical protein H257_13438 [Aphanomyces astaci]